MAMLKLGQGEFLGITDFYQATPEATVSVTHYDRGDGCSDLMHYHEHPNFYFILNGGSIEKRMRSERELHTGSLRFYQAGEFHQNIRQGGDAKSINLEVNSGWLRAQFGRESVADYAADVPWAGCLVLKIYKELLAADAGSAPSVQMLLTDLIHARAGTAADSRPSWMKRVNELLLDRWDEFLKLEELASESGVSPVTISKQFHRHFGCTLGEYMRRLKVSRALQLLRSTDLPLTEITYRCGFADQSHFIRCFKQYTGFLPVHFRKA
jgi:AraC family transcriptional regulator